MYITETPRMRGGYVLRWTVRTKRTVIVSLSPLQASQKPGEVGSCSSLCSMVRECCRHSLLTLTLGEDWTAFRKTEPSEFSNIPPILGSVPSGSNVVFLSLKNKTTDSSIQTTLKSLYPNFCLKEAEGRGLSSVFYLPPTGIPPLKQRCPGRRFSTSEECQERAAPNNKGQVGAIRFQQSQGTQT